VHFLAAHEELAKGGIAKVAVHRITREMAG
jgi:hypothetical protein